MSIKASRTYDNAGLQAAVRALATQANTNNFVTAVVAAAGSGQSTYTALSSQINAVTGADGTVGVALPAAADDLCILVINTVTTAVLPVAPVNGGNDQINSLTASTGVFSIAPGQAVWFIATSATKWYAEYATGQTPGTAGAYLPAVLGANKNLDTLVIADSGLKLGSGAGTAVTATAAELNKLAGVTAGAVTASKALVVGAASEIASLGAITTTGTFTITDANIVGSTNTGTKIGTATGQKFGFWNAAPVAQQANAAQAAVTPSTSFTGADTVDKATVLAAVQAVETLVNRLRLDLVTTGIIKGAA